MNYTIKSLFLFVFTIFSLTAFSQPLSVEIQTVNPSGDIDNGEATALINGGVEPYKYYWSIAGIDTLTNNASGLSEGITYQVTVSDATGAKVTKDVVVATDSSAMEKVNAAFIPFVQTITNIFFWDPFAAIGLYDNRVIKKEEFIAVSKEKSKYFGIKEWLVEDGQKVIVGEPIIVVENDKTGNIRTLTATEAGRVVYFHQAGDLVRCSRTSNRVSFGEILMDTEKVVLNPNGTPLTQGIPFIVVWLIGGAIFFTIRMKFINFRGLKHAYELIAGKFSDPNDEGEVSHFQALTTALSATVGLGNIAGVAVAITLGGAGATFWMILAGLLGMTSKFVECTLGVKYRLVNKDGEVSGGPMYYLSRGLEKKNMKGLGKFLAGFFAILCVGASFGGGNMFQANQAFDQIANQFPGIASYGFWFGVVLAVLVGIVIIGGIKSIAKVTDKIVPVMVGIYVLFSIIIIGMNITNLGDAFQSIIMGAFDADALRGGFIGVLIVGFQRAAFSNEAGVGSASIAHSASKTKEPVSEGIVALLEPFIDTVVVCTMTALVLVFTGYADGADGLTGAKLTSTAFSSVFPWFSWILMIAIILFAFSTMVSWSYYGQKAWCYLFGTSKRSEFIYKGLFLVFVVVGSSVGLGAVLDFSDLMILGMAFPNILGLYLLSKEVRGDLKKYFDDIRSGVIKRFK